MAPRTDQPTALTTPEYADVDKPAGLLPRNSFALVAPVYTVKLVQTGVLPLPTGRPLITSPAEIADLMSEYLDGADREHLVAVLLGITGYLIGVNTIAIGDLASTLAHPREVFKAAILANAASMILAHNHPSGEPHASPADIAMTKRLMAAGELLGIEVKDHIIIGSHPRFFSVKENGLCP